MTLHTLALALLAAVAFTLPWEKSVAFSVFGTVPIIGLSGSVLAVATAGAVQIGGNLYILRRAT